MICLGWENEIANFFPAFVHFILLFIHPSIHISVALMQWAQAEISYPQADGGLGGVGEVLLTKHLTWLNCWEMFTVAFILLTIISRLIQWLLHLSKLYKRLINDYLCDFSDLWSIHCSYYFQVQMMDASQDHATLQQPVDIGAFSHNVQKFWF